MSGGEILKGSEAAQAKAPIQSELQSDLREIAERQSQSGELLGRVEAWQEATGQKVDVEIGEHGYPILDLTSGDAEQNLAMLRAMDPDGQYVYHGMQNNEFRRDAGMPDVAAWESLDPKLSHQEEGRKRVYATTRLDGGLTHALIEHRFRDANLNGGQTYALKPFRSEDGRTVEFSPALAQAMGRGEVPFVDGLLYILPAGDFKLNPESDHEVVADHAVQPIAVVRVGADIGPLVVQPDNIERQA